MRLDLPRMNAELRAEAEGAREREVGEQARLVVDIGSHSGDRRREAGDAREAIAMRRRIDEPALVAGEIEVDAVVQRAEGEALHAAGA